MDTRGGKPSVEFGEWILPEYHPEVPRSGSNPDVQDGAELTTRLNLKRTVSEPLRPTVQRGGQTYPPYSAKGEIL
jgi:hypothetical protein